MATTRVSDGLRAFVDALGGRTPTPAGGAAAAAAVACGVGLLLKVGRIAHAEREALDWKEAEARLGALASRALDAVQADSDAFDSVLEARRHGAAEEKAWIRATIVPLDVIRLATQALLAFAPSKDRVKKALEADCLAAAALISAGISISLENARGNLTSIRRRENRERLEQVSNERQREALEALSCFGLGLLTSSPLKGGGRRRTGDAARPYVPRPEDPDRCSP